MNTTTENPAEIKFNKIVDELAEKDFAVLDDFFSPDEVCLLSRRVMELYEHGAMKQAGIGNRQQYQTLHAVRGDVIKWMEKGMSDAGDLFLERMQCLIEYLNRTCYLGIRDSEFHFALYPPGTFYKRHSDNFKHSNKRKLSVVCYLNKDWAAEEGGQLRLFLPEGSTIDINPSGGRIACFFSHIEHEVLPATRTRMSITGWLLDEINLVSLTGNSTP